MSCKILCVDDEVRVLDAYRRGLRRSFEVTTAEGGEEALKKIADEGPFAVVVSDMRMPQMDGVQLLAEVRRTAPETVRIMLTGNADQQTAVDAVNEGQIFRFLTKPCPPETMAGALSAGIEQYRLITAEKELLTKTLNGAIKVLSDVLSLTNPAAFGHASRVRALVAQLCEQIDVEQWECEVAATLSQIGCVTIPPEVLEKSRRGKTLTSHEARMIENHPAVGRDLVRNIPRLENVAEIIGLQNRHFDGGGGSPDDVAGTDIPPGARILKVATDYDALRWGGLNDRDAARELRCNGGQYDPVVLEALDTVIGLEAHLELREIGLNELASHMIVAEDIVTEDGMIVIGKGQEATASMRERLANFARMRGIRLPIRVLVRAR